MKPFTLILSALALGVTLFAVPAPAKAAPVVLRSFNGAPNYRHYTPNHMPGWDWYRTYPWSPYNYGRNPYNPIIMPYPAYYPVPYPAYEGPSQTDLSPAPLPLPPVGQPQALTPNPTGELKALPANAGGIQIRVPDRFAQVEFNGVKVSSVGTSRNYVTPDLPEGKPVSYTVTATFKRDGRSVTQEQQVNVGPGKTTIVDFSSK
jgi:uncharacterized protein (TIGR03000 family)